MLHPDSALLTIETIEPCIDKEHVDIVKSIGRILPDSVYSSIESPPFSKAAMDGYAVLSDDTSPSFKILETIAAGDIPSVEVTPGTCSRIMTGAMMPEGADKVVRVEFTEENDGIMDIVQEEPNGNVIRKGENLKPGDEILKPRILKPQDIGILASLGISAVQVSKPPLVGIITTGSELTNPGDPLKPGHIYNSNGYQLCAQTEALSCPWKYYGVVVDDPEILLKQFTLAFSECDFVLFSGGVSMGEFDFVPEIIRKGGAEIVFHKLAIKPGKPTLFARKENTYAFGLPGNPVSTFIIFEVMVKPALLRWMGLTWKPDLVRGTLEETIKRKDSDRLEYRPVTFRRGNVIPLTYHGSAHLNALSRANALIRIEQGVNHIEKGSELDVRLI